MSRVVKPDQYIVLGPNEYIVLIEEWNYPTESGREPVDVTFDDECSALEYAREMCEDEMETFFNTTQCDPTGADKLHDSVGGRALGYVITTKNGLDPWWYGVRMLKLEHGMENWSKIRSGHENS